MVPVIEQSFGASAYVSIRAGQVLLAVPFHPNPQESGGTDELRAGELAFQYLLPLEVLSHDIIHRNVDASLDRDDRLSGRHRFDIDYGAVGRAQ